MLILVIEDDNSFNEALCSSLTNWGHHVHSALDGEEALKLLEEHSFDLIFSDLAVPKLNGLQILAELRSKEPETPFYIITGYNDKIDEQDLDPYTKILNKPFRLREFKKVLDSFN